MSKKELIVTDKIWYKICNFFRKFFLKNKNDKNNFIKTKQDKNNFLQNISYINEITILNSQKELASKLMNGKLSVNDLSDSEVDEMIDYFNIYINEMHQKLNQIQRFILDLKNKK